MLINNIQLSFEKQEGLGEDAQPITLYTEKFFFIGTLDGVGGAGAHKIETKKEGIQSSARIGANYIGSAINEFVLKELDSTYFRLHQYWPRKLNSVIEDALRELMRKYGTQLPKYAGSMMKKFPTTLACMLGRYSADQIICYSISAGDSRNFFMSPETGLCQLSVDDTKIEQDAFTSLKDSIPMSNHISAGNHFVLNSHKFTLSEIGICFSATDGCFQYFASPIHFEWLLLDTLVKADSYKLWMEELLRVVKNTTKDDATLAGVCIGFKDFNSLKAAFIKRHQHLKENYQELPNFNTVLEQQRLQSLLLADIQEIENSLIAIKNRYNQLKAAINIIRKECENFELEEFELNDALEKKQQQISAFHSFDSKRLEEEWNSYSLGYMYFINELNV